MGCFREEFDVVSRRLSDLIEILENMKREPDLTRLYFLAEIESRL